VDADYDRHADELLAALGPDEFRERVEQAGDEYLLLLDGVADVAAGGPARKTRDLAEHGLPDGERLLPGEQGKLDRYRALRRKTEELDEP